MKRMNTTPVVVVGHSTDYMTEWLERVAVWNDGTVEVEHARRYCRHEEPLAWLPGFATPDIWTGKRASLPEAR